MKKKDFQNWSREKLLHEYKELLKRKKFGIVWEDKPENVAEMCKTQLPVLKEIKDKELNNFNGPTNIIIEGDNYHALSVLNYTHKRKIDVIYIDPPYNTGNGDSFKYNDKIVDREDAYRHSKWLSFMEKRLQLAKNLLKSNGVIYISIGNDELAQLKLLCDEIFGEINHIEVISRVAKTASNKGTQFSPSVDYILCYAKNLSQLGKFKDIVTDDWLRLFNKEDKRGKYREISLYQAALDIRPNQNYFITCPDDSKAKPPEGKVYRWTEKTFLENLKNDRVVFKKAKNSPLLDEKGKKSIWNIYTKTYLSDREEEGKRPRNFLDEFINRQGADLLSEMGIDFNYSKPVDLIKHLIQIINKPNSIIVLDFFAGSGTTGHAVLEINTEDSGYRQFILCTNNEDNNGNGLKIASDICYPRIRNAIRGYTTGGKKIMGFGGNLKYFSTDFVDNVKTDNDKRVFTSRCTEMLCLAEGTFNEVANKKGAFAIYENQEQMTGIIYDEDAIADFKKEARNHKKSFVVYVFSYDHTYNEEDFEDMDNLKTVKPIPEVILNIYHKIYKDLYKPKNL